MGMRLEDRRQRPAVAAADIDDPCDVAKIVSLRDSGARARGHRAHGVVEDRRPFGVLRHVREGAGIPWRISKKFLPERMQSAP
jgi:hypothetical protein